MMAAFRRPVSAIKAIMSAQKILTARNQGLRLKIGVHHGPSVRDSCIGSVIFHQRWVSGSAANADMSAS